MSLFMHPLIVSGVAGIMIFIFSYCWSDRILDFFKKRTFGAEEEVLIILEKLLFQNQKRIIRNCWIFACCLSAGMVLLLWPKILFILILSPLTLILTWQMIKFFFRSYWEKHCNKVVNQMVEGLVIMCNSLRVGLSLPQAMDRVIKGYPGPLSKEFRLVLNKTQLGMSVEEALTEMGERIKRPDMNMLVSAVNILKETGGNLAETFYVMADTMRERQKMDKKIKALTAQGRMQAKILSIIPFALIGIFFILDKDYIAPLIFKPLGWVCLAVVCVLVFVGYIVMKKMVEIKV